MKSKFTARSEPVDVVLNWNFQGNYYLCYKNEVDKKNKYSKNGNSWSKLVKCHRKKYIRKDSISSWEKISFKNNRGILGQIIYPEDDEIILEKVTYINQFEDKIYYDLFYNIIL